MVIAAEWPKSKKLGAAILKPRMEAKMEDPKTIHATYPKIPDHSDLRGFSYRAPAGYAWSDDHLKNSCEQIEGKERIHQAPVSLWGAVLSLLKHAPTGYRRSDDRIRQDICEALANHPGIDASEIEVTVREGQVFLRGYVPDSWMKRATVWQIDRVPGVREVHNDLRFLTH